MSNLNLQSEISVSISELQEPTQLKAGFAAFRGIDGNDPVELQRLCAIVILALLPSAGVVEAFEFLSDVREYYSLEEHPRALLEEHVGTGKVMELRTAGEIYLED